MRPAVARSREIVTSVEFGKYCASRDSLLPVKTRAFIDLVTELDLNVDASLAPSARRKPT